MQFTILRYIKHVAFVDVGHTFDYNFCYKSISRYFEFSGFWFLVNILYINVSRATWISGEEKLMLWFEKINFNWKAVELLTSEVKNAENVLIVIIFFYLYVIEIWHNC